MRVTGNLALNLFAAVYSSAMLIMSPLAFAADKIVHSVAELDDTLHDRTFSGRVIIPKDSIWLMERCDKNKDEFGRFICTPVLELPIYSGVTLMGESGENHGITLPYFHGIRVFQAAGKRAASPCVADNTLDILEPIRGQLGRNV